MGGIGEPLGAVIIPPSRPDVERNAIWDDLEVRVRVVTPRQMPDSLASHGQLAAIELGPRNASGHACGTCKDAELHRLIGVLRELAGAKPH